MFYTIIGAGMLGLLMGLLVVIHFLTFMIKNGDDPTVVSSQQEDTINQAIELYRSQE